VDGDLDDAVAKMRGEAGTQIKLTIYRPGRDEPFDLTLTRAVITLEPVTGKLEGNVAVITVNEFSHDVGRLVFEQIQKQRAASGNHLTGVVLDLRSIRAVNWTRRWPCPICS
jgi:carboxyl-terminal processing protease